MNKLITIFFFLVSATAFAETCLTNASNIPVCINDQIVDSSNYVGTVKEIKTLNSGGQKDMAFLVEYVGYESRGLYQRAPHLLSKVVQCYENKSQSKSELKFLGPQAQTHTLTSRDEAYKICVGDKIVDASSSKGIVRGVVENRGALIQYDSEKYKDTLYYVTLKGLIIE